MNGGGDRPYNPRIRSGAQIDTTVKHDIESQKAQLEDASHMRERLGEAKRLLDQKTRDNADRIPWHLVDHGNEHSERVEGNIAGVNETMEETDPDGLAEKELLLIKIAAHAHDVGRGEQNGASHAERSANYVMDPKNSLPLSAEERDYVAKLCTLHSDGATRQLYGTEDLNELVRRGLLSPRDAKAASLLRVADALDAGNQRVQHNSQGESYDKVTERIRNELPATEANARVSHWVGHRGFQKPVLVADRGQAHLKIKLDDASLRVHGAQVAYRVKDILRDISRTLIDKRYRITFSARNRQVAREWLTRHAPILSDELGGINVST